MALIRFFALVTFFASVVASGDVHAAAVTVPSSARPELIQKQYKVDERPAVTNAPVITVPEQGGKQLVGDVAFELKSIQVEGATVFSQQELRELYQFQIGKQIDLSGLGRIADGITAYYRNQGYILARAIVPPQKVSNGVARIQVVEGHISDVKLQGEVGGKNSKIFSYARKIQESRPLNAHDLERYLLLMEDLPGVEARAVLQPSPTTPGASQVVVTIDRDTFADTSINLNNRGTKYLGPWQVEGTLSLNNALGADEQTLFRGISTFERPEQLQYVELRHEDQVGAEGTRVIFDGSFVRTRPGKQLEPFRIEGQSATLDVAVTHPLIRSRQMNWFINSDFALQRVAVTALGTNLYEDNLRVLTAGTAYDFIDPLNAVNRLEANAHQGFNWWAGNDGLGHSRANGEGDFTKFTANATRIQPIYGPWQARVTASGQYSFDPLYVAQEFAIGGETYGSAYDLAEITGDSGAAARAELQYNGELYDGFVNTYQIYGFYDIGAVWNRNIIGGTEYKRASLASTGVGTRFNIIGPVSGSVEFAYPLTRRVAGYGIDGNSPRIYSQLQYRY